MLNKEVKRRGLRKSFTEKLTSFFDTDDISVSSRGTNIRESIKKTSPPAGQMEVVSDSDSSSNSHHPAVKVKVSRSTKGGTKKKKTIPAKPPKPPAAKTKKRAAEKATVKEIKEVLTRNNVKFKSKDKKADLLEIAAKCNLLRTIEYYHSKNS